MASLYRPRNARGSPLYRIVVTYLAAFLACYEERYSARCGRLRPIVKRAAEKFGKCGIAEWGFVRIRCPACRAEYLLPFSCRVRGLCPSCNAKRAAAWAGWVVDELVLPVPHRHVVFSLPRILRPYFLHDRSLLTDLARWAWQSLLEVMSPIAPAGAARPGALLVTHTAGNLLDFHPHVHALVTDGVFTDQGRFYLLPEEFLEPLGERFRARVLHELHARGLLGRERLALLRSWRHSGFSVFSRRRVRANDRDAIESLARYVRRGPIALERLTYQEETGKIIYCAGRRYHPRHKANYRLFEPLDFLAECALHVPDPWRHESIAYGEYANAARGKARRQGRLAPAPEPCPVDDALLRSRWRELLRRVFEVDPLRCPRCGGRMLPISVITDPVVIERILRHLGLWEGRAPPVQPTPGAPATAAPPSRRTIEHDPECTQADDDANQVPPGWADWD